MSTYRNPDEIQQHYVDEMGAQLGEYFGRLWQEVAYLHWKWQEFIELFGRDPSDVEILNQVAPSFFRMLQDMWWHDVRVYEQVVRRPTVDCAIRQKDKPLVL